MKTFQLGMRPKRPNILKDYLVGNIFILVILIERSYTLIGTKENNWGVTKLPGDNPC